MIDRAAIFTVNASGFSVYICIKGNLHEYKGAFLKGTGLLQYCQEWCFNMLLGGQQPRPYPERIPSSNGNNSTFSTVCLSASVKSGRRRGHDRGTRIEKIQALFTYLLDFFYTNQIDVCFGSIKCVRGCLATARMSESFSTPVQHYALTMLRNVGYSVEQKLYDTTNFGPSLLNLAGRGDDGNDKFYRLCLYLFRRATEYHFLNVSDTPLRKGNIHPGRLSLLIDLCSWKKNWSKHQGNIKINWSNAKHWAIKWPLSCHHPEQSRFATVENEDTFLHTASSTWSHKLNVSTRLLFILSFAYVPSVRITPTTIKVQPLKLVKLHRVAREKSFNDPMSFALVEIRDEANKPLYASDFRSLREKFWKILSKGIRISGTHYSYLHHSMSQVKEKQFWFLHQQHSLPDVLSWMGNFDNERVVAKHAARIAQCFTSTEPSIRVSVRTVEHRPVLNSIFF